MDAAPKPPWTGSRRLPESVPGVRSAPPEAGRPLADIRPVKPELTGQVSVRNSHEAEVRALQNEATLRVSLA